MQVSVIIPTCNRFLSLNRALACLARQTCRQFEVILVDDGSSDQTRQLAGLAFPFPLRYFRQPNAGEHLARNLGALHSRADLLVFLDDDILVQPAYLDHLLREHETHPHLAVLGAILPPCHPHNRFEAIYTRITSGPAAPGGWVSFTQCLSGVLSVRRDDFFAAGMMQLLPGDLRNPWGGLDFGYRAHLRGLRFRRCGRARCHHDDYAARDFATYCRRWEKAGQAIPLLLRKHPGLLPHVPLFWDKLPLAWKTDPPSLILRKLFRRVAAWGVVLRGMELLLVMLERSCPHPLLLAPLYRWISSSYLYRGVRRGLRQHGCVGEAPPR